ncbi:MAG TPA: hypothetical protein DCX27_04780 [Balneola sp.]|nr:hypothetical protein [Balneola sp.]|tara:strand:+ start:372 stop:629 length:258 start_codon:yes stop_codon:yes gene_type:complete
MIKTLDHKTVLRWSGEETYSADDVKLVVSSTEDYETASIELADGRVLVIMILDDRGAGEASDTSNTNGTSVASKVRTSYNTAKGL